VGTPVQGRGLTFPIVFHRSGASRARVPVAVETKSPSDDELMLRLAANDSSALDVLFDRYSRLVLGVAVRILRDYGEAEEVVQDAFFTVFQKARLFDSSKGTAKGWIFQIAYHRTLDQKAYLARRDFYRSAEIGCLDDTLLGETDLDREIGARLNHVRIAEALEELPEVQRRTLKLFYFEGLELREIADKISEPLGNVRHHFYRGLERLRKNAFVQTLREK
jgi:RNA polymerase sigma-70 factor (ECF subfamily)